MDYPFTSWTAYFAALTECLSTEYYGEKYPKYEEQIDEGNTDARIINGLLDAGLNPQEGLNGFIKALLDGSRYASEMSDIDDILVMFIEKGATPDVTPLFEILYPEGDYFEDEVVSYEIRGRLIDSLEEYIQADKFYDWSSIEATHWEEIDEEDYTKACYMYLKHCSEYLQTL
jgi:hypothetical protein